MAKAEKRKRTALAEAMKRRIAEEPQLTAARRAVVEADEPDAATLWALEGGGNPSDYQVLDIGPSLVRARLQRQAQLAPPFGPRELLQRARITAPLIERLIARGDLPPRAQEAADEIRFAREAASLGSANIKPVDWQECGGGGFKGSPTWPAGSGGGRSQHAELVQRLCIAPWERDMVDNPPKDGRGRPIASALLIVKAAVLHGPSLEELERMGGVRHGQAKRVIREGLGRYSTFEELMATRGRRGKAGV